MDESVSTISMASVASALCMTYTTSRDDKRVKKETLTAFLFLFFCVACVCFWRAA